jgi:hypothetical protein
MMCRTTAISVLVVIALITGHCQPTSETRWKNLDMVVWRSLNDLRSLPRCRKASCPSPVCDQRKIAQDCFRTEACPLCYQVVRQGR